MQRPLEQQQVEALRAKKFSHLLDIQVSNPEPGTGPLSIVRYNVGYVESLVGMGYAAELRDAIAEAGEFLEEVIAGAPKHNGHGTARVYPQGRASDVLKRTGSRS